MFKRVCIKTTDESYIYCGRSCYGKDGSVLANRYRANVYGLEKCLYLYRRWLFSMIKIQNEAVLTELNRLLELEKDHGTVSLGCWCRLGSACHVDIIIRCLDWYKTTV